MYFEKCDRKELNRTLYRPGKNQKLIMEFYESGLDVAEVLDFGDRKPRHIQSNLRATAMGLGIRTISVKVRGDRVFLVRTKD